MFWSTFWESTVEKNISRQQLSIREMYYKKQTTSRLVKNMSLKIFILSLASLYLSQEVFLLLRLLLLAFLFIFKTRDETRK